jgi:homocysteine S-methyltransferase
MAAAPNKQAALAEGLAIAQEMLAEVRGAVQGVQVSAPFGNFAAAAEVLGLGVTQEVREITVDA